MNTKKGARIAKVEKALRGLNRYCPECEEQIYADETRVVKVLFCPDCGKRLLEPHLCVVCGNPVNAMAAFCTGCGCWVVRGCQDGK